MCEYGYMGVNKGNEGGTNVVSSWHEHNDQPVEDQPATCTTDGFSGRTFCEECNSVINWGITFLAPGHSFLVDEDTVALNDERTAATCVGVCCECGEEESFETDEVSLYDVTPAACTAAGEEVYEVYFPGCCQSVFVHAPLAALGHNLTAHAAVPVTCTTDGSSAYWSCETCGNYFSDENGETEITENSWVVRASGHDWGAWTKLNDDEHRRVCANDISHVETEAHSWEEGAVTPATVDADGSIACACAVCDATKTEPIAKIGEIALSASTFNYNGGVQQPDVTVTDVNGAVLTRDTDYTVSYSDGCQFPGSYTVTVTFSDNYAGSETRSFTIAPLPPAAASITAKATGNGQITVAYAQSEGATQYNIYRYNSTKKDYVYKGTTYYYRVVAVYKDGTCTLVSAQSQTACAVAEETLFAPTGVTVEATGDRALTIRWDAHPEATQFNIYRWNSTKEAYVYKGTTFATDANPTQFTDKTVYPGTTYYYRVVAVIKDANVTLVSRYSSVAFATATVLGE